MPKPRLVTVEVTQDDIDLGEAKECQCCPVGLALRRVVNRQTYVAVRGATVEFVLVFTTLGARIKTPHSVRRFTTVFDGWPDPDADVQCLPYTPKPFKFELDIPDKFLP